MEVTTYDIEPLEKTTQPINRPVANSKIYSAPRLDAFKDYPPCTTADYAVVETLIDFFNSYPESIWGEAFNIGLVACKLRPKCLVEDDDFNGDGTDYYNVLKKLVQVLALKVQLQYKEEICTFDTTDKKFLFVSAPSDIHVVECSVHGLGHIDPFPWPEAMTEIRKNSIQWMLFPTQTLIYCEVSRVEPPQKWIDAQLERFQILASWITNTMPENKRFSTLRAVCAIDMKPSAREEYEYMEYVFNSRRDQEYQLVFDTDFGMLRNLYGNFVDMREHSKRELFASIRGGQMKTSDLLKCIECIHDGLRDFQNV